MQFNQLSLGDKTIFDKHLSCQQHDLAAYAFENIIIWRKLYKIFWARIDKQLCVFFKDRIGCFLYLPPLGKNFNAGIVRRCFQVMDRHNKNTNISRIENIEKRDIVRYKNLGFEVILGSRDYVCDKSELASLKGNRFKAKRAGVNFFTRNYEFKYQPYRSSDKRSCLDLYRLWAKERKAANRDTIYQGLLDDNFVAFKTALDSYDKLGFVGRTVKIENKVQGATFGYPLTKKTFVVLFEVCNLKFKGMAQYIFREFCREQSYPDINIMDDSGLVSLKKVKLSYHPKRVVENFITRYA